jgi:putative AlgH/UPF0301 family transcriptional regulator
MVPWFLTLAESAKLLHKDARRAVMSLRNLCFYALLITILVCTAVGRFNRHRNNFDVPEADVLANGSSLAAGLPRNGGLQSGDFLPVQSRSAETLGVAKLLVASRDLGDPSFAKTVILLVRYDPQAVLGLFLNRRTKVPLSRVLESPKEAKDRSDPVYVGGPVEMPAVFALFQSPGKVDGAENIFDGVYLITAKPLLEKTISARPDAGVFHVYLGYAGWTQDQLQQEVKLGAWFVFPAESSKVFNSDPESLWDEMIRKTEMQMARRAVEDRNTSLARLSSDLK